MSSDLAAFLCARLDEDETTAKDAAIAAGPDWLYDVGCHDPARVLRKVEAGRAILALYVAEREADSDETRWRLDRLPTLEEVVRILAAEFSGHPDYQQDWKP